MGIQNVFLNINLERDFMSKEFKMKGIEFKDGIVKLYDERVVLFPPNIISLLGSVFGQGSKPLLVYLGKKMGRLLAENWEEHLRPKSLGELAEIFFGMTGAAGWGNFSVEKVTEDEIVIKLKDNIALTEEQPLNHICDFLSGYLAGFGEFAMYSAQVSETSCSVLNKGQECCEFKIMRRALQ
jgi:predicted hydrocarbon binding protein